MKKLFLALIFAITSFFNKPAVEATPTPLPQISLFPSATLAPSQSPFNKDADINQIKSAFAAKYGRKVSDVILTTTSYNGSYFVGTVSFRLAMAGGTLLAAKDAQRNWTIVMDGNGSIPCEALKPYSFPTTMVSECYNRSGKLIKL